MLNILLFFTQLGIYELYLFALFLLMVYKISGLDKIH